MRARFSNEMPLRLNILQAYHNTVIGQFSKKISDYNHQAFYRFMVYLSKKWRIYKNQRRLGMFTAFFGSFILSYIYCGSGKNLYTIGYQNGFYQPFDFSLHMMNAYGGDEKTKYTVQIMSMLKEGLDSQGECYDTLDWLMFG